MTEQKSHLYSKTKTYYQHPTRHLSAKQVESIFHGCERAYKQGMPLNRFITIHYNDYADPKRPQKFVIDILERTRKWLHYRGLPVAYLYVIENGKTKGIHAHILLHIPPHHMRTYTRAIKKWLPFEWTKSRVASKPLRYPAFGNISSLDKMYGTLRYMCKGIDPKVTPRDIDGKVTAWGISPFYQGEVFGKRWGMSENLRLSIAKSNE